MHSLGLFFAIIGTTIPRHYLQQAFLELVLVCFQGELWIKCVSNPVLFSASIIAGPYSSKWPGKPLLWPAGANKVSCSIVILTSCSSKTKVQNFFFKHKQIANIFSINFVVQKFSSMVPFNLEIELGNEQVALTVEQLERFANADGFSKYDAYGSYMPVKNK